MVKLKHSVCTRKNRHIRNPVRFTKQYKGDRRQKLKGGAGRIALSWNSQPEYEVINAENEALLILSNNDNTKKQHEVYYGELDDFLTYKNYEINMDFTNNFYKHIYYDDVKKYAVDIRSKQWVNDGPNIVYKIEKVFGNIGHQNTTILFLKHKTTPGTQKVVKIFNNLPVDLNHIREFLNLELSHISNKSRVNLSQHNYIYHSSLSSFDIFNFNQKKYLIHEVSDENNKIYLSCRNNDAINEYIINLLIGYINKDLRDPINYVHYDNLFVTTVYSDTYKEGKLCWCLIMDKVDGSLSSYIDKRKPTQAHLLDYLQQAEHLVKPFKTADYLFTHTDFKLENLFYNKDASRPSGVTLYLADLDKSSITFRGVRFYNNVNDNPNLQIAGLSLFDPVQGYAALLKGDAYTLNDYLKRVENADMNRTHSYRLSRAFKNYVSIEFEQFYMRYNNQPYYTSFDIISLWLSMMHYRKGNKKTAIVNFKKLKRDAGLMDFLRHYMTETTIDMLLDVYKGLDFNYNGNFGAILAPLYFIDESLEHNIEFLHHYDDTQPTLIKGLYLTRENKLALSLPFVPSIISVKGDITAFKPNATATTTHDFYKHERRTFIKKFIKALANENILHVSYSSDYSIDAEDGSLISKIIHKKPPAYVLKTNRYSYTTFNLGVITYTYYYEWDILNNDKDLTKLKNLFKSLEPSTKN